MRILPINIASAKSAKNNTNNNNNNNFNVNNYMQKDIISFSGKNVAKSLLDTHLDLLKRMKEMITLKDSAKSQVVENTNRLLENVNFKIKPLLNDDDFLWSITPEREKNKFSYLIVSFSMQEGINKENNTKVMSLVTSLMQKRILEGDSETLLKEFEDAGQKISKPEQQKKLQQLKEYILKKSEIIASKKEKINTIEMKAFKSKEREHLQNAINENYRTANVNNKTFNRELAKRAIQKIPYLKEIYSNSYKKNYNRIKNFYKKGEATQIASAYANEDVIKHLSGGHLYGLPF